MESHTRWTQITTENPDHSRWYIDRFDKMRAAGVDLDGEARTCDAIAPRAARIIDAGCGPGRTAIELARRGHAVIGLDIDPQLIAEADRAARAAGVDGACDRDVSATSRIDRGTAQRAAQQTGCQKDEPVTISLPESDALFQPGVAQFREANICYPYPRGVGGADLIVCAGNVMTFLAGQGPRLALEQFAAALAPTGQVVIGFGTDRGYEMETFAADCAAAGLVITQRFATWQLAPWQPDAPFLVALLAPGVSHQHCASPAGPTR
ncbi:MAG: methyltransferase domain-containing protein [Bowdeniella nasicola]|nr:methyltransferase domain-containing protein [Bowdeniella nasicola]